MLGLTGDNSEFIDFLCSTAGEQMMQENSKSIHLESGNLFYDNFNMRENFYDFLLNQQDQNKFIIKKQIAYYKIFEQYFSGFLQSFDYEEIDDFFIFFLIKTRNIYFKSLMLI